MGTRAPGAVSAAAGATTLCVSIKRLLVGMATVPACHCLPPRGYLRPASRSSIHCSTRRARHPTRPAEMRMGRGNFFARTRRQRVVMLTSSTAATFFRPHSRSVVSSVMPARPWDPGDPGSGSTMVRLQPHSSTYETGGSRGRQRPSEPRGPDTTASPTDDWTATLAVVYPLPCGDDGGRISRAD